MVRNTKGTSEPQLFKIGAVARLTGVSVHTLRKWEERHGVVNPSRSKGGKRLYTDADIQRLVLIKKLADQGLSLPSIAGCSFDDLANRWAQLSSLDAPLPASGPTRVAALGTAIATWLRRRQDPAFGVELVAAAENAEDLTRSIGESAVDVLAIECPAVAGSTLQEVMELMRVLDVPAAVVVYWFGNPRHIEALQSRGIEVLRAPVDPGILQQAIARAGSGESAPASGPHKSSVPIAADPLPPRLPRESLAKMAVADPRATCGCQKNLVDVALSLRALEDYLNGCENRSAEDEALHRALWRKVGAARSSIEDAIEHFAAVEGIEL